MKKLTAVAIAVLVASQAQATEIYKNDKTSLDLTGRAYAGQILGKKDNGTEKSERAPDGNNYIRLGLKGETVIDDQMSAIGGYEIQFKSKDAESDASSNLTTRLGYGGIKAKDFGTVTFGRQVGAVGTMAAWTDVSLTDGYSNEGLGIKADQYGTYRANNMLKYTGLFNNIQIDADYKFSTQGSTEGGDETNANMAAYGAAVSYTDPSGFSVGTGYNVAQREKADQNDAKLWIIGAKFDDKSTYAAVNFDKGTDYFYTAGGNSVDITGIEAALGYNFANGFGVLATYNKMKQDVSGGDSVNVIDYYTAGVVYKFNKNFRVMAEYRFNNKDDGVTGSATSATGAANGYTYKNDMQLAVRYDF